MGVIVTRLMSFFARREALATYVPPVPLSRRTAQCASGGALSRVSCGRRFSGFPRHSLFFTPVGLD